MEWLNYHHLLYFWAVAREGSIAKAAEVLFVAQPTISTQIKSLEKSLGQKLLQRSGRGLVLTEVGQIVYGYADDIFSLGQEMMSSLKQRPSGRPLRLAVGVVDSLPKLVTREILKPVFKRRKRSTHVICREGKIDPLLAELAMHRLDIVLCNEPIRAQASVKSYNHLLGESGISFFAAPKLATKLKRGFPQSLDGAPALLPTDNTSLRRKLDRWFQANGIQPMLLGEFEDLALMKAFASEGHGFTAIHTVIQSEISSSHGIKPIGDAEGCSDEFYAVSVERKLHHPAVIAITEQARDRLFS